MSVNLQVLCKLGRIGKDEIWQDEPVNEVSDQGNLNIPFFMLICPGIQHVDTHNSQKQSHPFDEIFSLPQLS